MVELGLPLATLVMGLLLWALWHGAAGLGATATTAVTRRTALMLVLMIGLHSLLEYPLWYAYFLLPAAWAWGFGHGLPGAAPAAPAQTRAACRCWRRAPAGWAPCWCWRRSRSGTTPRGRGLQRRPATAPRRWRSASNEGQRSVFFAHHADYAAATTDTEGPTCATPLTVPRTTCWTRG
jgi:hypothetical protein